MAHHDDSGNARTGVRLPSRNDRSHRQRIAHGNWSFQRVAQSVGSALGAFVVVGGFGHAQCMTWRRGPELTSGFYDLATSALAFGLPGGETLVVGGWFDDAGSQHVHKVARWTGSDWAALGTGFNNGVYALAAFDAGSGPQLFAAGIFTNVGGVAFPQIFPGLARWNGAAWESIGYGGFGWINSMHVWNDGTGPALYVGGGPVSTATVPVARWNGTAWSTLPGTLDGDIYGFYSWDDGGGSALYVLGEFTHAGGIPAMHIARWDGTNWSALGSGLPGLAAIAACAFNDGSGTALYVGGGPGGINRWDGSTWTTVGGGVSGEIHTMLVYDDGSGPALWCGGRFTPLAISPLGHYLAKWDGSAWSPAASIQTASNAEVNAMCMFDDGSGGTPDLCVVGGFVQVGTLLSRRVAFLSHCNDSIDTFCFGDGSVADCPCSNRGAVGHGCAWHANANGAVLSTGGTTSPDTLQLIANELPNGVVPTIFLKGDAAIAGGVPFGDGLRCVGGQLIRLGSVSTGGGAALYPPSAGPLISDRGQSPVGSGSVAWYQAVYRNAASFCTPSTFNITNGVRVVW